jgi:hypothetical protein
MFGVSANQLVFAWVIVGLVIGWSYLWKALAFWQAARRDHLGWFILIALAPTFGLVEMIYVFWIAPRVPEINQVGF